MGLDRLITNTRRIMGSTRFGLFMAKVLLDTKYSVETPEGIDIQSDIAGPIVRVLAYSVDLTLRAIFLFIIFFIVTYFIQAAPQVAQGILLIIYFLFEWFYPVFFEVYWNGQTPGKRWLKIAVVNDDLTPVTWGSSIVRNLLRVADFLPIFYLSGIFSMVLSSKFQRLGDLAASTLVIHQRAPFIQDALPNVTPRAPNQDMTPDDELAIIGFTQRHKDLSEDRQKELANLLAKQIGYQDQDAIEYLHSVGIWLMGGR